MKHIDYKVIFDRLTQEDFQKDSVVLGVLTQLGSQVYRIVGETKKEDLSYGVKLYWSYHDTTLLPKEGCFLVLPFWCAAGRLLHPLSDPKLNVPSEDTPSQEVQDHLMQAVSLSAELGSLPRLLTILQEAKACASTSTELFAIASALTAFSQSTSHTDVLSLWRHAQWECSSREILSWAWLFYDGVQDQAKGLELGVLAMHKVQNFSEGYETAYFLSQHLASNDKELIDSAMDSIERRFLLPDLQDQGRVRDARRHAIMFAKRWLAWAGNPIRAKRLIEKIMDCVSSLRQNQWDKLLQLATVMQDDDLVQAVVCAKNRRGVVQENWVV